MEKFKNRYIPTIETYEDYFSKASYGVKIARIEGSVIMVVSLLALLVCFFNGYTENLMILTILGVAGGGFLLAWHKVAAKRHYKEMKYDGGGGIAALEVIFFEEHLEVLGSTISYDRIIKVLESDKNIFFILGRDMAVTLEKDSFIGIEYKEFKEFIESKGKNFKKV